MKREAVCTVLLVAAIAAGWMSAPAAEPASVAAAHCAQSGADTSAVRARAGQPAPGQLSFRHVGVYGTLFEFCDFSVYKLSYFGKTARREQLARFRAKLHDAAARGKRNLVGLYTFDRIKHSRPLAEYIANTDAVLDAIDLHDVYAVFLSEENVTWNNGLAILNGLYEHIKKRYPGVPVYQWLTAPAGPHAKLRADGWVYDFYGRRRDEFRCKVMEYLATGKPLVMCLNASPDVARFESPGGRTVSEEQLDVCREFNVPVFFYCVDLKWGSPAVWLHSDAPEIVPWRRWALKAVDRMHATASGTLPLPSSQCSAGRTIEIAGDDANRYEYDEPFATSRFIYDATIRGFWNVRWDGLDEKLIIARRAGQMPAVELVYHFVSEFPIRDIRARLSGQTMGTAPVTLALSVTGNKWPWQQTARGAGTAGRRDFQITVSAGEASPVREFWVRITGAVDGRQPDRPAAWLDRLTIACHVEPPKLRQITLTPDAEGHVRYEDDFQTSKFLHLAHVTGREDLKWQPGRLQTHGVRGRAARVLLRWKVVSPQPLRHVKVRLDGRANEKHLGATNRLAVSLDGRKELAADTTAGKPTDKNGNVRQPLQLDLSGDARFEGVRVFWVHVEMLNRSGLPTGTSNSVERLSVEADAAR